MLSHGWQNKYITGNGRAIKPQRSEIQLMQGTDRPAQHFIAGVRDGNALFPACAEFIGGGKGKQWGQQESWERLCARARRPARQPPCRPLTASHRENSVRKN